MFLRLLYTFLFVILFSSCDFISSGNNTHQTQTAIESEIDYTLVDVYPLFRDCNGCDTHTKQNLCFESVLVNNLEKILNKNKFNLKTQVSDTIFVDLLIDKKSKIQITKINASDDILLAIPKLDSVLHHGLSQLPEIIQPALKRGIPVEVQFRLPIKIRQASN